MKWTKSVKSKCDGYELWLRMLAVQAYYIFASSQYGSATLNGLSHYYIWANFVKYTWSCTFNILEHRCLYQVNKSNETCVKTCWSNISGLNYTACRYFYLNAASSCSIWQDSNKQISCLWQQKLLISFVAPEQNPEPMSLSLTSSGYNQLLSCLIAGPLTPYLIFVNFGAPLH